MTDTRISTKRNSALLDRVIACEARIDEQEAKIDELEEHVQTAMKALVGMSRIVTSAAETVNRPKIVLPR